MPDQSSPSASSCPPTDGEGTPAASSPIPLETILKQARSSLRQTLGRYGVSSSTKVDVASSEIQRHLDTITRNLTKLDQGILRLAVFGLVSRGKSSVINALIQQDMLQTGPLHGVTKWPRSLYWSPTDNQSNLQVELIDTPGLDEVEGAIRAEMAQEVAREADLILFVVAGDITPIEYDALTYLLAQHKPVIVVANKMDRYPDFDGVSILRQLDMLAAPSPNSSPSSSSSSAGQTANSGGAGPTLSPTTPSQDTKNWTLAPTDVIQVAAAPDPLKVRVEWPDGRMTYEWEAPPAQIAALEERLQHILHQDGWHLITLNALRDSQTAEVAMASATLATYREQAENLLWQFAKWKGLVVAANPVAVVDLIGGVVVDLVMIRTLARLYDLPMTGYEANQLWRAIASSSAGLLLGEISSGFFWSLGKSTGVLIGPLGGIATYSTGAIAQAALAGYGSYRVGKATQVYLQQGCTWGPGGPSSVIQTVVKQMDRNSIIDRLTSEFRVPPKSTPSQSSRH